MTATAQKRLAVLAALLAVTIVVGANGQLLSVAFRSQPACVAVDRAATPAKRVC
ncbi:hypothetical protein [Loktanella sp. IMCC34160]|uniref:hypothetical protein n=1 Tax=Loktanella sp. IMCC34160 TaxID=2510646 RepID=UPI0013EB8365|nr:hypothetical protein [Loktanella sp. IMCC34160]